MKHSYGNPWHKERDGSAAMFFTTDKDPVEYRGVQIFFFGDSRGADFVKDGIAFAQRACKTITGAKIWIDKVIAGEDIYTAPDFTERPL